jgi:hypothetical protein
VRLGSLVGGKCSKPADKHKGAGLAPTGSAARTRQGPCVRPPAQPGASFEAKTRRGWVPMPPKWRYKPSRPATFQRAGFLLGNSLRVEQRTLTPLVLVRIQVPQPQESF